MGGLLARAVDAREDARLASQARAWSSPLVHEACRVRRVDGLQKKGTKIVGESARRARATQIAHCCAHSCAFRAVQLSEVGVQASRVEARLTQARDARVGRSAHATPANRWAVTIVGYSLIGERVGYLIALQQLSMHSSPALQSTLFEHGACPVHAINCVQ